MAVLDKWQQREAHRHAEDNGVTYGEAVAVLFPAEGEPAAPAAEGEQGAPAAEGAKVKGAKP